MEKHTIILDPGHGGIDPRAGKYVTAGKRSFHPVDGAVYYEGVEMRKFAKVWGQILETAGYDVQFTVNPNDYRDVPLSERSRIVNRIAADKKCLLFPIHSNAANDPTAHGHEVFTSRGITHSDYISKFWINEMEKCFPGIKMRKDCIDGFPDKEAGFHMIKKTICPALYIELLFHTNDAEVRILRSEGFKRATGNVLLATIKRYEEWLK